MTTEQMDELLRNWALLNKQVMLLDEDTVRMLLERESTVKRRLRVMLRIYNRYSKMRSTREKLILSKTAQA